MSQISRSPSCAADLPDPEILMSMCRANCFILLPAECDGVAAGEAVRVTAICRLCLTASCMTVEMLALSHIH